MTDPNLLDKELLKNIERVRNAIESGFVLVTIESDPDEGDPFIQILDTRRPMFNREIGKIYIIGGKLKVEVSDQNVDGMSWKDIIEKISKLD